MDIFQESLVKYKNPRRITVHSKDEIMPTHDPDSEMMDFEECSREEVERFKILDTLFPPRKLQQKSEIWVQNVSRTPATLTDLERLASKLDMKLLENKAREMGICPIRRELYDQCFDELVRQEAIVCPERGRLFQMVRRESKLSIESLGRAYESSLAYGIKKQLMTAAHVQRLTSEITDLAIKNSDINGRMKDVGPRVVNVKKTVADEENLKQGQLAAVEHSKVEENLVLLNKIKERIEISIDLEA